jgi:serpin B
MSRTPHVFALLAAFACSSENTVREPRIADEPSREAVPSMEPAIQPEQAEPEEPAAPAERAERATEVSMPDEVDVSPDALRELGRATNAFGAELHRRLPREGNSVMSPASIHLALDMTAAGARGETANEMTTVLHTRSIADVNRSSAAVLRSLNNPANANFELRVVNRLFGERTFAFEPAFVELTRASYGAPLEGLSFTGDAEGSRAHINRWVATQTNDRIRDLLPQGAIDGDTRLVLTNAVYLLAKWLQPFERDATRAAPFFAGGTTEASVPTMHQTTDTGFGETGDAKLLEMRYEGGRLAMLFVLPKSRTGLAAIEEQLSAEGIDRWTGALTPQRVEIALPKFRLEPGEPVRLSEHLRAMGMRLAFVRREADFTGIANPPDPDDRLHVSEAFHKAFIRVDEEGTEAAAATAVVMAIAGGMPMAPANTFIADRPFLFLLRDVDTGMVLFLGRVVDPR